MTFVKFLTAISKNIKIIRKDRGLTQEDMARFGFNIRHYQDIESGKINLTLQTLYRIAKALKVTVADLTK
jgi:transcriptional regulator with XRE-family HTH domain